MANCIVFTDPTFQPAYRIIDAITNANPAAITTSTNHDFLTGEIVRVSVPERYGMHEVNNQKGTITVTGDTTFTVDIDTTELPAFSEPATSYQCAIVKPIGEVASMLTAATKNILRSGERS